MFREPPFFGEDGISRNEVSMQDTGERASIKTPVDCKRAAELNFRQLFSLSQKCATMCVFWCQIEARFLTYGRPDHLWPISLSLPAFQRRGY